MEQNFKNTLRYLRLTHEETIVRQGPAHASMVYVQINVKKDNATLISDNVEYYGKTKEARRKVMEKLITKLKHVSDPCTCERPWPSLWAKVFQKSISIFQTPPAEWFNEPQVLGVDWEGQPIALVQIACKRGVAIDAHDAPWVNSVLTDKRHNHAVFGKHEIHLVGNPMQIQESDISLAETVSRIYCPTVRLIKDKSIHDRVDWALCARREQLNSEAIAYAALDAEMTRLVAITKNCKKKIKTNCFIKELRIMVQKKLDIG